MLKQGELHVFPDSWALAAGLADLFVESAQAAVCARGAFRVALSGGETPRATYELLAQSPRAESVPWKDVYVYFSDERCVPPTDERSNYGMAKEAFLQSVPIYLGHVHRMLGEIEPGHAANSYASILRAELGDPPHFDLVMLGLGPDGHTASLFPGTPPDPGDHALVRAVYADSQKMWRITFTPKLINLARTVVFAVEGAAKAEILAAVLTGEYDPVRYPAQSVRPSAGRLLWYVDEAAAAMLPAAAR
jgi:6-phosphogluconolactonase